ncbi:MAG: RNA polymerase sigma factor [Nocardioidaceae bacterium]
MRDVEFIATLYDASYRRLVGQLVGVTGSRAEAEDVVQEAFVRAINHATTVRRADNPEAWLRTVAVNVARSRWRRMTRLAGLTRHPVEPPDEGVSPDRVALVEALKRLPAAQREAIALHHVADLPVHEVAATLGVPIGTVKARLSRGRAALASYLSDHTETEARHD